MFELNRQMDQFHSELQANHAMDETNVNELMAHMRDEMDTLQGKDLSEEEAFWIARHRLGDTNAIHTEFSKVNHSLVWRKRMIWLLLGYFVFSMVPKLAGLVTIPFYLLDTKWLFFTTPLMGDHFPIPVPLHMLILLVIGSVFYFVCSPISLRHTNRPSCKTTTPRYKKGHTVVMSVLGSYLLVTLIGFVTTIIMARHYAPEVFGKISASSAAFSLLWHCFLFLSLTLLMCLVYHKKKDVTARA